MEPVDTSEQAIVSVVIPTCHRNDLLAKCLDCLAPGVQTLDADLYEVIVTDDGSASTAEEMVKASYPWAKWTQGPRKGPAANRNHGTTLAQGEWIAFTDDDCLPDPRWLEAYAEAINPEAKVYEGKTTCAQGLPSPLYASPTNENGGYLWSCNMMIADALFKELGGFDESYPFAAMEDVDLRERIRDAGYSFPFVETATVDHPPRAVPAGKKRGQMTASEYLFFARRGRPYRLWPTLKHRTYVRLREIVRQRKGIDSFKAIPHLLVELATIWKLFPSWESEWNKSPH